MQTEIVEEKERGVEINEEQIKQKVEEVISRTSRKDKRFAKRANIFLSQLVHKYFVFHFKQPDPENSPDNIFKFNELYATWKRYVGNKTQDKETRRQALGAFSNVIQANLNSLRQNAQKLQSELINANKSNLSD